MVQFHPFRDVAKEYNYTRVDPGMFNWGRGGGGGGVQTLVQKRLLNFLVANYQGGWRGTPYKRLIGMCCWIGSHFQD